MFKITRGNSEKHAKNYRDAVTLFNRTARSKSIDGDFTRLYCDLGDGNGYCLMRVAGHKIAEALKPSVIR